MRKLLISLFFLGSAFTSVGIATGEVEFDSENLLKVVNASGKTEEEVLSLLKERQEDLKDTREQWSKYIEMQQNDLKKLVKEELKKTADNVEMKDVLKSVLPKLNEMDFNYDENSGEIHLISKSKSLMAAPRLGTYGDVLVTLDRGSGSSGTFKGGHAAIVSDYSNSWTVESFAYGFSPQEPKIEGVYWHINDWKNRYDSVAGYHIKNAKLSDYEKAGQYAESVIYSPYNFDFWDKRKTDEFYCSQLVWRAWRNQGFDIDYNGGDAVWPEDIVKSSRVIPFYTSGI